MRGAINKRGGKGEILSERGIGRIGKRRGGEIKEREGAETLRERI